MKTINLTLYSFDDLPEDIQKQIIDKERWNIMEQCMNAYSSDYRESLNKFEEFMGIYVSKWNVDYSGYYYNIRIRPMSPPYEWEYEKSGEEVYDCIYLESISGKLLLRYLKKNTLPELFEGKYYYIPKFIDGKPICKSRRSRIIKECACPLTGMCYDMYLITPILQYLQKPNLQITYEDLMDKCVESFFKEWRKEYEYWADNEDAIREELHNNQYEDRMYYKDGRIYDGPLEDVA